MRRTFQKVRGCELEGNLRSDDNSLTQRDCAAIVAPKMELTWNGALKETELVCFSIVENLFKQSGVRPEQVRNLA